MPTERQIVEAVDKLESELANIRPNLRTALQPGTLQDLILNDDNRMRIEEALSGYINRHLFVPNMPALCDEWYTSLGIDSQTNRKVQSTFSFMRIHYPNQVNRGQVRYLLMKHANCDEVYKDLFYDQYAPAASGSPNGDE